MTGPSRILSAGSLARGLAEIAIIVAGVLIALAADAWRESREEDRMAMEYRSALIDDLVADSVLYAALIDSGWFEVQAAAVDSILEFLAEPRRDSDPITLAQWLMNSSRLSLGQKASATFDDMRSSGRLSLLEDVALRRSLIDYYGLPPVLDERGYAVMVAAALDQGPALAARLLGPRRNRDTWQCADEVDDQAAEVPRPLESPGMRACLRATGSFEGFDLGARMREEAEVAEYAIVMRQMRELGLRGATVARDQAAELRARLRREPTGPTGDASSS